MLSSFIGLKFNVAILRVRSCQHVLALVLVLLWGAPALARQEQSPSSPKLKMHRLQAGMPNKEGWYEARSTEGLYQVKLPIPFNDATIVEKDKDGKEILAYEIGATSAEKIKFVAVEIRGVRRKPQGSDEVLKGFVADFKKDGNTVSEEKSFKYAGYPAAQFKVISRRSSARVRYILLPDRLFMLVVECPHSRAADAAGLIDPFFDSLEIFAANRVGSEK